MIREYFVLVGIVTLWLLGFSALFLLGVCLLWLLFAYPIHGLIAMGLLFVFGLPLVLILGDD